LGFGRDGDIEARTQRYIEARTQRPSQQRGAEYSHSAESCCVHAAPRRAISAALMIVPQLDPSWQTPHSLSKWHAYVVGGSCARQPSSCPSRS